MDPTDQSSLQQQVRSGRSKFIAMAVSYSLGTFNDNFYREATCLLAVAAGRREFQQYAMIVFALPYLLVAAQAGWLADRFPKRRVVIGSKALEVAAMLCGAAGILTGSWPLMLAMVCLMGLQSCIFSPSLNGSIPELYPAAYVTTANAKLRVATTGAILLGIGLAGPALDVPGRPVLGISPGRIAVALVVFLAAAGGLAASFGVPSRPAAGRGTAFPWSGPWSTLKALWTMRRDRLLATVILTDALVWFTGSAEVLIINVLGLEQFGLSNSATGSLVFAQLFGFAAGGLVSTRLAVGERWHRVLAPSALGLSAALGAVALVPLLPGPAQVPSAWVLLALAGVMGGIMVIPCESFVQVRPEAHRRGSAIAAANFAVFTGILLSGPAHHVLLSHMAPTTCFTALAVLALLLSAALAADLPAGRGNMLDAFMVWLGGRLLRLRYRIEVSGLDDVAARGTDGVLFLPNHPALIDPIIVLSVLWRRFAPLAWADQDQVSRPVIGRLARRLGVRSVPAAHYGPDARRKVEETLRATIEDLRAGRCVLLYPSGHAYRARLEDLRGNTAVHRILEELPGVRVALVRTRGLWGSRFSWASGRPPDVGGPLKKGVLTLLLGGVFFGPRRRVTLEFHEPDDLPRSADRETLNRCLEEFYNRDAQPNTYVPYTPWERGGRRQMPEPFVGAAAADAGNVPEGTHRIVLRQLEEMTGATKIGDADHLGRDLGMDSLGRAELIAWLESEFGLPAGDPDSLQTVADVLLAACGEAVQGEPAPLEPVPSRWFERRQDGERLVPAQGDTVTECFLRMARRHPGRPAVADQTSGVKTFRDLVAAAMALRPGLAALPGRRLGIMLPASVAADTLYLTALFCGKTPVMVNWTVGERNVRHSLDLAGVERVITARALLTRIAAQGVELSSLRDRFVFLEDIGAAMPLRRKLGAWLLSRLTWASLERARPPETAVILFTSGSESLPKAVPLTHASLLANLRGVMQQLLLRSQDRLVGILPPFHSFGLTATVLLPLCAGGPVVYHPNPTQAGAIGRLIEAYGVTVLVGTPTFLNGIVRASAGGRLATLRLAVTGAEKCPDRVYQALKARCPQMTVLEGYGVTECSPIIAVNVEDAPRPGTIGKVLPSLDYAIVDLESGQRAEPGRPGMLLVRGPSVFAGYLAHEGASPFVEFEGKSWYRTGDLVSRDEEAVLTFRGRLKRFAKLGGEMVSLPAIEEVLAARYQDDDAEAPTIAVEATPDDERPEVVLFTTLDLDREAVNRRIREAGLSALHNVRRVIRLEQIPLLGTGKTDYRALRETLAGRTPPQE